MKCSNLLLDFCILNMCFVVNSLLETHGWLHFVPHSSMEWGTKRNQPWVSDDKLIKYSEITPTANPGIHRLESLSSWIFVLIAWTSAKIGLEIHCNPLKKCMDSKLRPLHMSSYRKILSDPPEVPEYSNCWNDNANRRKGSQNIHIIVHWIESLYEWASE